MRYVMVLIAVVVVPATLRCAQASCPKAGQEFRIVSKRPTFDLATKRPYAETPEQAIAVDLDGNIVLLEFDKDGTRTIGRWLGYELIPPPDFPFTSSLPKDQVLFELKRLSCPERKWRLWIAATIGFAKSDLFEVEGLFVRHNFLYIFKDEPRGRKTVLEKSYFQVEDLVVADINHDGITEIVVQSGEETVTGAPLYLEIWQVDPDGNLQAVSLENVENEMDLPESRESVMKLGSFRSGDGSLYTEQEVRDQRDGTALRVLKVYSWDKSKRRYNIDMIHQYEEKERK
jgi:hypothetical protein